MARMSGIQLTASQTNIMSKGKMRAPSTESLNVWTQRKVTVGAASMLVFDQYPVAPDMVHPTARPSMMDADFISGEPNCSTIITETKTEKPRPMSFGSPLNYSINLRTLRGRGNKNLPKQRPRSIDARAHSIEAGAAITVAAPAPILHSIADQVNTDE